MRLLLTTAVLLLLLAQATFASDGRIEVNQAAALAGVTAGDAAGFPVTTAGESMILTGNLSPPFGTSALQITASLDNQVIDLNGFTIDGGSGGCTASASSISCPAGTGVGIDMPSVVRVTVRNGTVKNFAGACIDVGANARVEQVRVTGCSNEGIRVGNHSIVAENSVYLNGGHGIAGGSHLVLRHNVSEINGGDGINAAANALVSGNVARANKSAGIRTGNQAAIHDNVAYANSLFGIKTGVRSQIEGNVINDSLSGPGIEAGGDTNILHNIIASNGSSAPSLGFGVDCGFRCSIQGNSIYDNYSDGITMGGAGAVNHNSIALNRGDGINCNSLSATSCGIVGNTIFANFGWGLDLTAVGAVSGIYKNNTFDDNVAGDVSAAGLDPGYQNSCSNVVPCP